MEMKFKIFHNGELSGGLAALKEYFPFISADGIELAAVRTDNLIRAEKRKGKITVEYSDLPSFFYAFSFCMQNYEKEEFSFSCKAGVKNFGFMRDCARNGAINYEAFKELTVFLALMGYTYIELYMEDLMKIEALPYLGLNRPAYSKEDIKKMEAYAALFGIELVPCIQTLAHLPALFRGSVFEDIHDKETVLLCDSEKTYEFLEKVIAFAADAFKSRRINVGMDEAHFMCLGRYEEKFGYPRDKGEVFLRHLEKVIKICGKYGFRPSVFSDMFFRCGLKNEKGCSYENIKDKNFTENFAAKIPKDITLVFWDYNHDDADFYDTGFEKHFQLTRNVSYACGTWSWKGFSPYNTIGEKNSLAALQSCKRHEINDFLVTFWGDGGGECSTFSVLSTLLRLSEENYFSGTEEKELDIRSLFLFGNTFGQMKDLENANVTDPGTVKDGIDINPCKYLLYSDALTGVFDWHVHTDAESQFLRNARLFKHYKERKGRFSYLFDTLYKLSTALAVKAPLGVNIKRAYDAKDNEKLKEIAEKTIPECIKRIKEFYDAFSFQWQKENRFTGSEVGDIRVGGLLFRLEETAKILKDFLSGMTERIEELEEERLPFYAKKKKKDVVNLFYTMQVSGSTL